MAGATSQTGAQPATTVHRALSDPSRVRILELLQDAEATLDAGQLARLTGLHTNTVRSHLRLLAEAGLVSARREEPSRPGRPRLLYQAAAQPADEQTLASYRLLAHILASQLASSSPDHSLDAEEAGRAWGAHLVQKPPPFASISQKETIDELVNLHERYGFKPELRQEGDGQQIVLNRCPFKEIATTYQTVICPLHLGLIRGALVELKASLIADRLEPFAQPGACVAHLTPLTSQPT